MVTGAIRCLDAAAAEAALPALAAVLADCVAGGAGVSFMQPFSEAEALAWWQSLLPAIAAGRIILLAAEDADGIAGTVQVHPAQQPNQAHRADVAKLLVHRRARRQGLAEALMRRAEQEALGRGRPLLVLDTVPGTAADRLYRRLGWQAVGIIPGYARLPEGPLGDTCLFYKWLGPAPDWQAPGKP